MENKKVFGIKPPKKECEDRKCPFHGNVNVKKKSFTGTVVSSKMRNSAVIEWTRRIFVPKYERYTKKTSKMRVHKPECIDVNEGDVVRAFQTRPISKTINFTIVKNLGQERLYEERKSAEEEGKAKKTQKEEEVKEENESNQSEEN